MDLVGFVNNSLYTGSINYQNLPSTPTYWILSMTCKCICCLALKNVIPVAFKRYPSKETLSASRRVLLTLLSTPAPLSSADPPALFRTSTRRSLARHPAQATGRDTGPTRATRKSTSPSRLAGLAGPSPQPTSGSPRSADPNASAHFSSSTRVGAHPPGSSATPSW